MLFLGIYIFILLFAILFYLYHIQEKKAEQEKAKFKQDIINEIRKSKSH